MGKFLSIIRGRKHIVVVFYFLFAAIFILFLEQYIYISCRKWHLNELPKNYQICRRIHHPVAPLAQLEMISFTGPLLLWVRATVHIKEVFSSLISTFQQIIHSNHQRLISPHASIIQILIATEASALIS